MRIINQKVELISHTPDPSFLIERIARVCYNSEEKMRCVETGKIDCHCESCKERNEKFLYSLASRGHDSVFEHGSATFKLITSRAIANELVRHRIASYTQESTRYVKFDNIEIISTDKQSDEVFSKTQDLIQNTYNSALKLGISPQFARDILPLGLATKLYVTANFREWKHILKLRTASGAHPHIIILMSEVKNKLAEIFPAYFRD